MDILEVLVKTVSDPVSLFSHLTVGVGLAKNRQVRTIVSSSDTIVFPEITKSVGGSERKKLMILNYVSHGGDCLQFNL